MTFGKRSVVWLLNGREIFADARGVGPDWHAFLIVNLSVCAGRYHPKPEEGVDELSYGVESLIVRRG